MDDRPVKNVQCEGEVAATTFNVRLSDRRVISEMNKHRDRATVAIYRSDNATVIVSQLYPIVDGEHKNPYPKGPIIRSDDDWPEG